MLTKICPKCNHPHQKDGTYCTRHCANSRGPRTEKFKISVANKLTKTVGPYCIIKLSPITGRFISSDSSNRTFWDTIGKESFIKKICNWFEIIQGVFPDTEIQLQSLRDKIYNLYHTQGYSSSEIRDYLNIPLPDGHMPAVLKQLGIARRNNSESQIAHILKNGMRPNKSNRYKTGWFIDHQDKQHFYRSSYELNAYEYLTKKCINFDTETLRIKYVDSQKNIIIGRLIVEIKSDYTLDIINMRDKFNAYRKLGFRPILILNGKVKWCTMWDSNPP